MTELEQRVRTDWILARRRALLQGTATGIVSRAAAVAAPVVVLPLALHSLGVVGYGAWVAALSLSSVAAFADLGIGTGVMTRLGRLMRPDGISDRTEAQRIVAAGYLAAGAVSAVLLAVLAALYATGLLRRFIVPEPGAPASVTLISWVTLAGLAVNITLSLITRIQYGVGRQSRSNVWQGIASMTMLVAVVLVSLGSTSPVLFVLTATAAPALVMVVNSVAFFRWDTVGSQLRPDPRRATRQALRIIVSVGRRYFLVSLLLACSVGLDPWIVGQLFSLADAAAFAVPLRIFSVISALAVVGALQLWPMHSSALGNGDLRWIRSVTRRATALTIAGTVGACVITLLCARALVSIWLKDAIPVDPVLWLGLALWCVVQSATAPALMLHNGAERLRYQIVGYLGFLITALPLKLLLAKHLGYQVIPWISAVLYGLFLVPAAVIGYRAITAAPPRVARVNQ